LSLSGFDGGGEILESWVRRVVIIVFIDIFLENKSHFHADAIPILNIGRKVLENGYDGGFGKCVWFLSR
jgi:hypothetical protein